jgi:hypothetical protein
MCFGVAGCNTVSRTTTRSNSQFISFNDARVQYEGRVGMTREAAELYWSGTTVRIMFEGTGLKALLQDFNGQNYYDAIIDKDSMHKLRPDTVKRFYTLAENLPPGKHVMELFKRTQIHKEYKRGYTRFYGFQVDDGVKVLNPPELRKRKIEFYGNSITCGHAIEDTTGNDSGASVYENNYLSYAAITARHYDAQYTCISKSGIGLMVSFGSLIMPEMYNRLNAFDSTSLWDFSKYEPDIVVVNLLQNDEGIVGRPNYEQFKRRFGSKPPTEEFIISAYQEFIQMLRSHYPNAQIICVLGSMGITREGSKWPGYVEQAVRNLQDKKIYTHFFKYRGSPRHPLVKDHKIMAESLIKFIDTIIKW